MKNERLNQSDNEDSRQFDPLEYLAQVFELDDFERYCVRTLLTESDHSEGFTVRMLVDGYAENVEHEPYFWPDSRLLRYFFLRERREGLNFYFLEERIRVFLQGNIYGYAPYDLLWEMRYPDEYDRQLIGAGPVPAMELFLQKHSSGQPVFFHLYGREGSGRKSRILEFCKNQGHPLLILDAGILEEDNQELLGDALRECRIYGAYLLLKDLPEGWFQKSLHRSRLFRWMTGEAGVLFTIGEKPLQPGAYLDEIAYLELSLELPDYQESTLLWERQLQMEGADRCLPQEWANKFLFTPGQIEKAVKSARQYAFIDGRSQVEREDLQKGCYHLLQDGMGKKAVKIKPCYTWEELILPPFQKLRLKDACNQVSYKKWVYETWGFAQKISYGRGISVVFAGPPGTGKTMAAQVMASELCLDLYRIELAAVVSKYVGETEKNLEEIFEQAKKSQVILFFDEADVLFSKRIEVRDSNDKYSNMEAAFLLQKMEEYEGITILATNYLQNFDEAFKRRMKFIIDFPFPDADRREQIWRRAFPDRTPVREDLDYEFLSTAFELSGSNIKNVALHAAFLAAVSQSQVSMAHIIAGIRNEYAKSGKILTKEQLGQYYMLLDD